MYMFTPAAARSRRAHFANPQNTSKTYLTVGIKRATTAAQCRATREESRGFTAWLKAFTITA